MAPFELNVKPTQTLCEASRSARKLPVNYKAQDKALFAHELDRRICVTHLLELNHVNVSPEGIVFRAGRIFAESFGYRNLFEAWSTPKNLLKFHVKNHLFRKKLHFQGKLIWIIDNWSGAYFHWLTDTLSRLYVIRDRLAGSALLLLESYKSTEYILPSLAPFAVQDIKFIGQNEVLHCSNLLVPTHTAPSGNYNENVIGGLRRLYTDYYRKANNGDTSDKIYISRSKARVRHVINEREVMGFLEGRGFQTIHLEDYPFERQVNIMMNARYVVSNHGAGLTNMLFMPAGSSVLELRKVADCQNNCYFALASALNHKYFYQLCGSENPEENAFSANIHVDPAQLSKNLDQMLAS